MARSSSPDSQYSEQFEHNDNQSLASSLNKSAHVKNRSIFGAHNDGFVSGRAKRRARRLVIIKHLLAIFVVVLILAVCFILIFQLKFFPSDQVDGYNETTDDVASNMELDSGQDAIIAAYSFDQNYNKNPMTNNNNNNKIDETISRENVKIGGKSDISRKQEALLCKLLSTDLNSQLNRSLNDNKRRSTSSASFSTITTSINNNNNRFKLALNDVRPNQSKNNRVKLLIEAYFHIIDPSTGRYLGRLPLISNLNDHYNNDYTDDTIIKNKNNNNESVLAKRLLKLHRPYVIQEIDTSRLDEAIAKLTIRSQCIRMVLMFISDVNDTEYVSHVGAHLNFWSLDSDWLLEDDSNQRQLLFPQTPDWHYRCHEPQFFRGPTRPLNEWLIQLEVRQLELETNRKGSDTPVVLYERPAGPECVLS